MNVEQIYTGCLAQGAYYIESEGEVAIIDPLREVDAYIAKAAKNRAKIKYIFETHFHADFVSGHVELAQKTGAKIIYGPKAKPDFECEIAADEQIYGLGKLQFKVLHTPGHTLESTCYLLLNENEHPYCVFTGDTLFIGDVGRPDLAQKSTLSVDDLAGYLYTSLHTKILTLPDHVIIYPAHGAGSACGKNMSKETWDTLGNQRLSNYALKAPNREEFIAEVTEGLLPPPYYFSKNVAINKSGANSAESVRNKIQALSPEAFELAVNELGALMIDTRPAQTFKEGFIPNAINIGIKGDFAPWVGTLVKDIEQAIVFIADPENTNEVITRLSRVGYDNIIGYLEGGFEAWKNAGKEIDQIKSISAEEFFIRWKLSKEKLHVKDVRKESEYEAEHVAEAESVSLAYLSHNMEAFSKTKTNYIHCAGGYRSMVAASILKSRGFDNVIDIKGGYAAIAKTEISKTDFMCQSKLKNVN
jgi:hydroxyacylglutathione hydrolase